MDKQETEWERLHEEIDGVLRQYGQQDQFGKGDYWLVDDNWGNHQHKIEIQNPSLIRPQIISLLQRLLSQYADWEIVIGLYGPWPRMGLIVHNDEIVDGLQRQHLPREFRDIRYENSKPWTAK